MYKVKSTDADQNRTELLASHSSVMTVNSKTDSVFKSELTVAGEMDMMERVQSVINSNYQLRKMIENQSWFNESLAGEIANNFSRILCISRATLDENINHKVSEDQIIKLINETEFAVENLITLLSNGKSTFADLGRLEFIQTGSNTLNHMNRMLIRVVTFLAYYNQYFTTHSNDVKRIRTRFKESFHPVYLKLFSDPQNINLEIVFKGGMSPISDKKIFLEYALGGFFHDIGKIPDIEYHDSDEGFVPVKARRHVFDSYNMLLQSGRFPLGTVAMGLLHHDYYNASYGYRQRETIIKKFDKRKMDRSDSLRTKYCMSHNVMDVAYGIALSYFPSKILEILDIYDAMTDPDKNYRRSSLTPDEALDEMKKSYIEKNAPGIDPILFNVFIDFLKDSKIIIDSGFADSLKI
jgi:HD-GYP domain-containing protein (c-di-GMP phosphodiesterase class II)